MLHQVVDASAAVGPQSEGVLAGILEQARSNNARDELTGMLMTANQCYFQILEGNEDKIETCLDRLRLDRRHTGMMITTRSKIEARMFPVVHGLREIIGTRQENVRRIRHATHTRKDRSSWSGTTHTRAGSPLCEHFFIVCGKKLPTLRRAVLQ